MAGRKLSSFELSRNLFGILPVVENTGGFIQAVTSCHIFIISSSQVFILLGLLGNCSVKVVTFGNSYV